MSQPWTRQPNRQRSLETTIPALCSILFALISGVFVAAAMTDAKLLDSKILAYPLVFVTEPSFCLTVERRYAVLIAATLAGICFYKSLLHCVWSQMSHFDDTLLNPDVQPVQSNDPAEMAEFDLIKGGWNERRIKSASSAILYFDIGVYLLPLSMIFLLPPSLLALSFYAWMVSLYGFVQAVKRS